mmetsp:Transcript_72700/g.207084  ORF Transcript_72700/g.207084 Transcript_72700/m.207084 type:complete len:200 (+) Transcript_72700:1536-2135(+)
MCFLLCHFQHRSNVPSNISFISVVSASKPVRKSQNASEDVSSAQASAIWKSASTNTGYDIVLLPPASNSHSWVAVSSAAASSKSFSFSPFTFTLIWCCRFILNSRYSSLVSPQVPGAPLVSSSHSSSSKFTTCQYTSISLHTSSSKRSDSRCSTRTSLQSSCSAWRRFARHSSEVSRYHSRNSPMLIWPLWSLSSIDMR